MLWPMRRLAAVVLVLAASAAPAQFRERIDVVRILLDVRVTDSRGEAITGLGPADFNITIGGKHAEVESVEWVDESSSRPVDESPGSTTTAPLDDSTTRRPGRLIVIFVQTDFARESFRVGGQMGFMSYADKLIDSFTEDDRIAVMQFDSHLKFRLDFTSDKEAIQAALRDTLQINDPPEPPAVPSPSLASRLDRDDMRRAADSETGLIVLGNALRTIDGPKTILLFGWGLGRFSATGVHMTRKYEFARRALDRARATIFSIDLPRVDYHSLQAGLQQAAADTGGLYVKAYPFPALAVERLQRTLAGHYEIELRRPDDLKPGMHTLDVRVKRRGVYVLAPSTYTDRH